jgi:hypothetical protein
VTDVQGFSGALRGAGATTPFSAAAKDWLAKTRAANRVKPR